MYLKAGEKYTVEELLTGLLLASGNDAAEALACHVSGSVGAFAELMNEKCLQLGMNNSHFMNPHGLNEDGHYSTARDLAVLMNCCMDSQLIRRIISKPTAEIKGQYYVNHNKLLNTCEGCIGGKTGYTEAAGRCLVSCCEREGMRLVCVTLNDAKDWEDHENLYNWAFSNYRECDIINNLKLCVAVIGSEETSANVAPRENTCVFTDKSSEITVECELPRFVFAPVIPGAEAGEIRVYINGVHYKTWTLYFE